MKRSLLKSVNENIRGLLRNLPENKAHSLSSKTIDKWNNSDSAYSREGFKCYWELLEDVQQYQVEKMTGGRDVIQYLASFFPKGKELKNLDGLIIGCMYGENTPANAFARTGAFQKLLVVDIADGLLMFFDTRAWISIQTRLKSSTAMILLQVLEPSITLNA